jgi:hypothetical protein
LSLPDLGKRMSWVLWGVADENGFELGGSLLLAGELILEGLGAAC